MLQKDLALMLQKDLALLLDLLFVICVLLFVLIVLITNPGITAAMGAFIWPIVSKLRMPSITAVILAVLVMMFAGWLERKIADKDD